MKDNTFVYSKASKARTQFADLNVEDHPHEEKKTSSYSPCVCMADLDLYEGPSFDKRMKKEQKIKQAM